MVLKFAYHAKRTPSSHAHIASRLALWIACSPTSPWCNLESAIIADAKGEQLAIHCKTAPRA